MTELAEKATLQAVRSQFPLYIFLNGTQGMVPDGVVYELREQQSGDLPHHPAREAVAFLVVELRVDGEPAVTVAGGCIAAASGASTVDRC